MKYNTEHKYSLDLINDVMIQTVNKTLKHD